MFYTLSKTLDLALSPLTWSLLLALACGVAAARSRTRSAWVYGLAALAVCYGFSSGWVASNLFLYVERFEARPLRQGVRYDAVILVGGFVGRGPDGLIELSEGGERLLRTWELLSTNRAQYAIIAAGGDPAFEVEADVAAQLLQGMGVDRRRLLLDRTSRNTRENALQTKAIAERASLHRLVLVTSAFHMQRAVECLRAVGIEADALATDHQAPYAGSWFEMLAPRASNLAQSELALRELSGRWVYRLRGYASAR